MKLTTARLKKLIREELSNVKEAISIPGYEPKSQQIGMHKAQKEAVAKVLVKYGIDQQQADEVAHNAANEFANPNSAYAINFKKSSNPRHSRMPEGQREEYFMIIVNLLKGIEIPEGTFPGAIAEEASYEAIRAMHNFKGTSGIRLPFDHTPSARMQRD